MKLSVCIPVYNFDVRELVLDLKKEIENYNIDAEIILIDDASEENFKTMNAELQKEVQTFIFLEDNIGRSKIRNLFLEYSNGEYLLFLDCDGKIISSIFLLSYIQFIKNNKRPKVIYGGRKVSDLSPDKSHYLRWKFAMERENQSAEKRQKKPYLSFQTNNFIINREVLKKVPFNAEYQKYGYEDLLFAMELKDKGIMINHIDNVIFNNDLETNDKYLIKIKESIESLAKMQQDEKLKSKIKEIKIIKVFNRINESFLRAVSVNLFQILKGTLEKKLQKGNVNLRYLDFYKLGLLLKNTN
ncbi:MAG: glycosyltransferase [Candidatus Chryseobacterium colombiense]|nr:glycosyltransferase [Chryseobacterium sp.]WEK68875.1 MAG: glycosyltransferase [Chryseobacterium sp.]